MDAGNWTGYAGGRRWATAGPRADGSVVAVGRGGGVVRPRWAFDVAFRRADRPGEVLRCRLVVAGVGGREAVGVGVAG